MKIERNKDLLAWNTFGMRVFCGCFVEYESVEELRQLWSKVKGDGRDVSFAGEDACEFPRPFLHIGRGSNLLFTKDFPGTVFHGDINFIRECPTDSGAREVPVEVGAGVIWDEFCNWCAERGLWGPENLSGIPGETGAAAVQNIGAYGVEIKDIINEVHCFDTITSNLVKFKQKECHYGYRDSIFKQNAKGRYVVTSVVFTLSKEPKPRLEYSHVREAITGAAAQVAAPTAAQPQAAQGDAPATAQRASAQQLSAYDGIGADLTPKLVRRTILNIRDSKLPDPTKIGSAGSFFKNPVVPFSDYMRVESTARIEHGEDYRVPHFDAGSGFVKIPAAWLIDQCGWKGYAEGNVAVWHNQPLVLVNATGQARPEEILELEDKICRSVERKFGIRLEPEVEHI